MNSAKKFKNHYPTEEASKDKTSNLKDKAEIEAFINKIKQMIESDPENQKKLAQLISQLINKDKK